MSDILTINTDIGSIQSTAPEEQINPLPVFDENFYMLKMRIPEYGGTFPNPFIVNFSKRLLMTMNLYGGIGLSANQCGVDVRMFVLGQPDFAMVCLNPTILKQSEDLVEIQEGCLSYPGFHVKIARPAWIDVEFMNEHGKVFQNRLDGITARSYLHELDHLNGIRFIEHAGPVAIQMARKKQTKLVKQYERNKKKKNGLQF